MAPRDDLGDLAGRTGSGTGTSLIPALRVPAAAVDDLSPHAHPAELVGRHLHAHH